jgi:hypothetical protein
MKFAMKILRVKGVELAQANSLCYKDVCLFLGFTINAVGLETPPTMIFTAQDMGFATTLMGVNR